VRRPEEIPVRHLIVLCDGTWQTTVQQSNVVRLREALAELTDDGTKQECTYVKGVGTAGTVWNRVIGGVAGVGLSANVRKAYRWLAEQYRAGDVVALFGFSRGAYTARSLAGMIGACGLLDLTGVPGPDVDAQVARVYRRYRERDRNPRDRRWRDGLRFRYDPDRDVPTHTHPGPDPDPDPGPDPGDAFPVHLIGVWDTVGALGVPAHLGLLGLLDVRKDHEFHDVRLNPRIRHARHAIALDEMRGPFTPTLWADVPPEQDVRQVWFPGDHADVGGGHLAKGLSDGALMWMIEEAEATVGIAFDKERTGAFDPDPGGPLHPRRRGLGRIVEPVLEVAFQPRPRAVPRVDGSARSTDVHDSAYRRQQVPDLDDGPYRPTRTLDVGESAAVDVPADHGWFATGLYLASGEYRFRGGGEWRSAGTRAGPAGATGRPRSVGNLLGTLIGRGEALLRRALGSPGADLVGARREPDLPWLSLVGVVASEVRGARGEVRHPDECIAIGAGTTRHVARAGYLHAFANDAWGCYVNNAGTVRLTVTRTA
jgi:uncharacterized protein (DUF2235 family)